MAKIIIPEKIDLKNHPEIDERMIQNIIANDTSILGIGELILKDKERNQPRAGRLDLLMQDSENPIRYEIEIQLGRVDESHIIRTIEYWDIEKKRFPHYEHCAVIIAEDITSRFLNIINLFNGFIPLIAIQMNAYKFGNEIGLVFTKIIDEMPLGQLEDEEDNNEITNREYWLKKATESTVLMADELLEIINDFKSGYTFKYNKFYIGLTIENKANNFVIFNPKKKIISLRIKLPKSTETDKEIENEFDEIIYDQRNGRYKIRLNINEIAKHREFLKNIFIKSESFFNS